LLHGQTAEKPLAFDAASIKPHNNSEDARAASEGRTITGQGAPAPPGGGFLGFTPGRVSSAGQGVTARKIVLEAYRLTPYQLSGGPGWLDSDAFDLQAKSETANESQLRQMLQTLLAERFQLVVLRETKEMPVYALTADQNGTKLRGWKPGDPVPMPPGHYPYGHRGAGTMQQFADFLSSNAPAVGRPVLDKTGLKGAYVFLIGWDAAENFIPAMQEQLGLKLESQNAALDAFVIDRIEKP
jgi:uncharacterized protein (TIGR03435 family)